MNYSKREGLKSALSLIFAAILHIFAYHLFAAGTFNSNHVEDTGSSVMVAYFVDDALLKKNDEERFKSKFDSLPIPSGEVDLKLPPQTNNISIEVNDDLSEFRPSQNLDSAPVPVSEPDIHVLGIVQNILVPVKARLYIDENGVVVKVKFSRDFDITTMKQLEAMFIATRFIPGRREMVNVPSYIDIELSINDFHS